MDVRLDNQSWESASNLILFTGVPNILRVQDDGWQGRASVELSFTGNLQETVTGNSQYSITFLGESITNVMNFETAVNKNFYISNSNETTAYYVAKAFRNCPSIIANFSIRCSGDTVYFSARQKGEIANFELTTNIPTEFYSKSTTEGYSEGELAGGKVTVDVLKEDLEQGTFEYVTTLEKNVHNGEAYFNLSPVLATFAEYERYRAFQLSVNAVNKDGEYSNIYDFDTNYISVGYKANQGEDFLLNEFLQIAANYSRGRDITEDYDNATILYVYEPVIWLSIYAGGTGGFSATTTYLDSAGNFIASGVSTWRNSESAKGLFDLQFPLEARYIYGSGRAFDKAFYIDIQLGNGPKLRYNVIKPLKAAEYAQRIYWRNSKGGISFFDFTGGKTIDNTISTQTYQKQNFDYYDYDAYDRNSKNKPYDIDVNTVYTLKSHLIEADGRWIFNDLILSKRIWTIINDEYYQILIDSLTVNETDSNNLYEATIKFHFSMPPSSM